MSDVVGTVASEDGVNWTLHLGNSAIGLKGNTAYKVRPVGPEMGVTTLAAEEAPEFLTKPTITAPNSTLGSTLGGSNGTWKGNPMPTLSQVFWLKNSAVIPNQNGGTLSTATGFAVDDQIIRAAEIESIIAGQTVKVTEYSLPFVLTAQPTLQATITPDPLVAGEDFEIVIDPAPDSVSPLTLVRDADDPRRYTGTAPDSGTLAIGATKAGYQPWSQTYTYDPAPVVEPGSITVESDGTISITVPDDAEPFDVQIGADVVTIDPAAYTPTGAPVVLGQPDIAGTGGDGEVLTVQSRALFAGHADAGEIAIVGGWYRNETAVGDTDGSYTQDDAVDGDRTLTWRDVATNTAGSVTAVSNGILCPAAEIPALPAGMTFLGGFQGDIGNTSLTGTHTAPVNLGPASEDREFYFLVRTLNSGVSGKVTIDGVDYPLTPRQSASLGFEENRFAVLSAVIPGGGQGTLTIVTGGSWRGAISGEIVAVNRMTLVASTMNTAVAMVAGTPITINVANTQVGDQFLAATMAAPYSETGIFASPVVASEILDRPLSVTGPQLWIGTGVETAAANPRAIQVTPSQPGNVLRFVAHFRSA